MELESAQRTRSLARFWPTVELTFLAILAALVVLTFRMEFHRALGILWLESAIYFAIPVVIMLWVTQKYSSDPTLLTNSYWIWALQTGAFVFALLPLLAQLMLRPFGIGDAFEVVALATMMNACWFLTVFSRFGGLERVAFVLGSALVLFVCFMTQNRTIYVFAFLYALFSLWWLLGNYWNRVKVKAIDGESNSLPIRGIAIIATVLVVVLIGGLAASLGPVAQAVGIKGIMPSSGGDSWHDSFSRSGIGDGDMLTAGQNAQTSGAVDSEEFIEDTKSSMYDIISDRYEGPLVKRKKQNRAVALNAKAKHMHKVIQSEQSGKSFRTFRQPKNPKEIEMESRITEALFFVEGPVPARFTLDCFHHFDGWDWTKSDLESERYRNPPIMMEKHLGKPWYVIKNPKREYLASFRSHRVKMMRLVDEVVPAPPMLKSWHIYKVEESDLFLWDDQGLVRMAGEFIAPHTMIDVVSLVPNYYILRNSKNIQSHDQPSSFWERIDRWVGASKAGTGLGGYTKTGPDSDSPYVQVADNATKDKLLEMTNEWTKGEPAGFRQVEAIVNAFRDNFELDPTAVPPDDLEDSVGWFLENRKGSAYLFATAATQSLRAAGYQTRLASGFLATYDDYDRIANQSVITSDNLHMWPEVCLDGWHWLPVEPTPGYPIPYNTLTFGQWIASILGTLWNLVIFHPLQSLFVICLAVVCYQFWRILVANAGWLSWSVLLMIFPGYRLKLTRKLLDLRFWAANMPRPDFVTPTNWYSQLDGEIPEGFIHLWQSSNFNSRFDARSSQSEIYDACCEVVQSITLKRLRLFADENKSKADE